MNEMFSQRTYRILRAFLTVWLRILHPVIHVHGRENIPEGPCMLCCNHSCFSDPVWVIVYGKLSRLPRIMAKQELMKLPVLGWLYRKLGAFPVDRGATDLKAVQTTLKTLREGNRVLIFPEGTRVRKGKRVEAHSGALLMANRAKVPVVPIYVSTKKHLFSRINLSFGKPYFPEYAAAKATPEELTLRSAELLEKIYAMGDER